MGDGTFDKSRPQILVKVRIQPEINGIPARILLHFRHPYRMSAFRFSGRLISAARSI